MHPNFDCLSIQNGIFKSTNVVPSHFHLRSAFDYDTENMNSEDIYSSLKGVTEAIQNFSFRSQEDMNEPVQRRDGEEVGMIVFRLSIYLTPHF